MRSRALIADSEVLALKELTVEWEKRHANRSVGRTQEESRESPRSTGKEGPASSRLTSTLKDEHTECVQEGMAEKQAKG